MNDLHTQGSPTKKDPLPWGLPTGNSLYFGRWWERRHTAIAIITLASAESVQEHAGDGLIGIVNRRCIRVTSVKKLIAEQLTTRVNQSP